MTTSDRLDAEYSPSRLVDDLPSILHEYRSSSARARATLPFRTLRYGPGTLDGNSPRRSVYLTLKRSEMVPLLQLFDAPESIQSIGERSTTTAATQALALMNAPFVRQRAEKLSQRVNPTKNGSLAQVIEEAYQITLSRLPSGIERQRMQAFIEKQAKSYSPTPKALELALTDFCQVLLCLNEFVYVD